MRVTIINLDNSVSVNGKTHFNIDFSEFPDNIHAVQWYETYGEIEYVIDENGVKPANERIDTIEPFTFLLDRWELAEVQENEKIKANQPTKEQMVITKRNAMLIGSDWTQLADVALSQEKKQEWATYRQALRDITDQPNFPDVSFPTKPTN